MSRKRRNVAIVLVSFVVGACASAGALPGFPLPMDPATNATVVVLRSHNFVGMSAPERVFLDGDAIARVGIGQYVCFQLRPGSRTIGIDDESMTMDLQAGQEYYFRINPKTLRMGEKEMDLVQIPREDGRREMAGSEDVSSPAGRGGVGSPPC